MTQPAAGIAAQVAGELGLPPAHVAGALHLLAEANTIPFIARYRKERTGSMDEVTLRTLRDRAAYLADLEQRRAHVLETLTAQGQLTDELRARLAAVTTKQALEDLFLPFRPKRRTRASAARDLGLGPLAERLFGAALPDTALPDTAFLDGAADAAVAEFLAGRGDGLDAEAAWAGCRDILAERVAEDAATRAWVREATWRQGRITGAPAADYEARKTKFSDYYAFDEALARVPAHRYLALRRGENEKVLRVAVVAPEAEILAHLRATWLPAGLAPESRLAAHWALLLDDAWRRLLAPSIATELRARLKDTADEASIALFAENLGSLLLQPPGGQRVVLGLDPGLRTGTKWAAVDGTGRVLETGTIHPLPPQNQAGQSAQVLERVVRTHRADVLAVGNGTASRELLTFVRGALKAAGLTARPLLVNEAGASVYSASPEAREELPDLDVTLRGAVSIARRWQDPLAELVKIDPRSIGVGQYQHDVNQGRLRQALDDTVQSAVNAVGVNVNTASWALLRYVSGLSAAQARELVLHRDVRGPFPSRESLLRVPRLGAKAFEQCAGFLRIPDAAHPLDSSAVHPEHYAVVERMAADLGVPVAQLVRNEALLAGLDLARYVTEDVGLPTLEDIRDELRKPGRDPREPAAAVQFSDSVSELAHLRPGMQLAGVVTNVTQFGAFVDLGVHQDGLVHVSQLADRFVRTPSEVVHVGQPVQVTVLSVDPELRRIALSMKSQPDLSAAAQPRRAPRAEAGGGARPGRPRDGRPARTKQPASRNSAKAVTSTPAGARGKPAPAPPAKPSAELNDVLQRFQPPRPTEPGKR